MTETTRVLNLSAQDLFDLCNRVNQGEEVAALPLRSVAFLHDRVSTTPNLPPIPNAIGKPDRHVLVTEASYTSTTRIRDVLREENDEVVQAMQALGNAGVNQISRRIFAAAQETLKLASGQRGEFIEPQRRLVATSLIRLDPQERIEFTAALSLLNSHGITILP